MVCTKHLLVLGTVSIYLSPSNPSYCQTNSLQWRTVHLCCRCCCRSSQELGGDCGLDPALVQSLPRHMSACYLEATVPHLGILGETPASFSSSYI